MDRTAEDLALRAPLSGWKAKIVLFAGTLGAPGLFLISFLDSSVLTFPVINDLLLIELCIQHPLRMPLYATMAGLGSLLGCLLLYFIAKRGEEAFFHKRAGQHAHAIRHWVEKNGFVGTLMAALLPPPTPFKIFVIAAGVFEMPVATFASAIALARAIRYGNDALPFLAQHKLGVTITALVFGLASYAISRLILRHKPEPDPIS